MTPTFLPTTTALSTPAPQPPPSNTLVPTSLAVETPAVTPAGNCGQEAVCSLAGHFFLKRPIPPSANVSVDHTYRYGSTQSGLREPHHGVEFPNAQGTPVLAVADGTVIFAGSDKNFSLAWVPAYYGNVVVIQHQFSGLDQPVFSLYAHLFKVDVLVGQKVGVGQLIGEVGATGTAIGSHLHFEVRLGNNDYRSNRNPELWLAPLPGSGVLAGRIETSDGNPVKGLVNVQRIEKGQLNPLPVTALETYDTAERQPVQPDDNLQENFAAGELTVGEYRLSLVSSGTVFEQDVEILPGRLTFVRFTVK